MNVMSLVSIVVLGASLGCGKAKSTDVNELCNHLVSLPTKQDASDLDTCRTELGRRKSLVGDEAFGEFATCASNATDNKAARSCMKMLDEAATKLEDKLEPIRTRVYAACMEMGKSQVVLERTDEAGGREWGHSCIESMMKVHARCDATKVEPMLACLKRTVDPDLLKDCVAACD